MFDVKENTIFKRNKINAVIKPKIGPERATFFLDLRDKFLTLVIPIAIKGNGINIGKEGEAPSFLDIR